MIALFQAVDRWLFLFATEAPIWLHALVLVPLGALAGHQVWWWTERMGQELPFGTPLACPGCRQPLGFRERWRIRCRTCGTASSTGCWATMAATALLFGLLAGSLTHWKGQSLTEGGSIDWYHARLMVQLAFVCLLVAATVIDLQHFVIPDEITLPGAILGVGAAMAAGHLQFVPAWIDWNDPLVRLHGPFIPEWIKQHSHWHGLAVSTAGLVTGAGLTWLVRLIAAWILGREALGFGDVTLMGMIGSFLGWQPVVLVFLLAPLCGLVVGLACWLTRRRAALPYGPFLAAAAVVVLLTWRWLWGSSRKIFSDPQALAILFAVMLAGLIVLLGLLRLYWAIPVEGRRRGEGRGARGEG